jgi:hypothetical protein
MRIPAFFLAIVILGGIISSPSYSIQKISKSSSFETFQVPQFDASAPEVEIHNFEKSAQPSVLLTITNFVSKAARITSAVASSAFYPFSPRLHIKIRVLRI